jgi:Flp pilus assembly protein TadB
MLKEQEAEGARTLASSEFGPDSREAADARKLAEKVRRRVSQLRERLNRAKTRKALSLLNLDVEPHEADALSTLSGIAGFAAGFAGCLAVVISAGWSVLVNIPAAISAGMLAMIAAHSLVAAYPQSAARRLALNSLGKSPEAVCYMAMSLNLVPSLERAVQFAAEHSEEPISGALREVIWKVETRQSQSVDDSFADFAAQWSGSVEELKMSLYSLRGAVSEKSKEGRARVLEKATESALSGTRRRIEEFAAGLGGPATILFALGILLPLVVGSMLPMMALGTMDVGSLGQGTSLGADPRPVIVATVILMDVAFPGLAFVYASHVLGKRPGTSSNPRVRLDVGGRGTAVAIAAAFTVLAIVFALGGTESGLLLSALFALGAVVVPVGVLNIVAASRARSERRRVLAIESEFPDALFQLGRKVSEGTPLEAAIPAVGERLKGSEIGRLFVNIGWTMSASGLSPERAIFDEDVGALRGIESRTISAALRSALASAEMDPQAAGKMMMDLSGYLRGLQNAERGVRLQLSGVSENMRNTAMLFAPLIMGVTVGLFALLSRTFADVGEGVEMMPIWSFAAVVGVYLALMVAVISHFCSRLLYGEDPVELKWRLGTSLVLSWLVFFAATAVSYSTFA